MKRFFVLFFAASFLLQSVHSANAISILEKFRLDAIAATYQKGETDKAVSDLNNFLKKYPKNDLAWTILGHAYADLDKIEDAKKAYKKAVALNPKRFEAITGLGILHRKLGEYDEALNAYQKSVKIDPGFAQAYSSMAIIYLKKLADKKALEYAVKGYELDKKDPTIAANLAVVYHYNDKIKERTRMTKVAEKLGYKNIGVLKKIYSGELTVRD